MIAAAVVFLVIGAALDQGVCCSNLRPAVNLLIPEGTEVMAVSFNTHWSERDNIWARTLPTELSWTWNSEAFFRHLKGSKKLRKQFVAVVPSYPRNISAFLNYVESLKGVFLDVHWLLIQEYEAFETGEILYEDVTPIAKVSVIRICKRNESAPASNLISFVKNTSFVNKKTAYQTLLLSPVPQKHLSGQSLKAGCLHTTSHPKTPNVCERRQYKFVIRLLQLKNVSLSFSHFMSIDEACRRLTFGQVDMLLLHMTVSQGCSQMFAHVDIWADTFYARANGTRVISFFEILSSSVPGVALTVTTVGLCAALLATMNNGRTVASFLRGVVVEATFLVAVVFAQCTPAPRHRKNPGSRRMVYLSLLLAIFPLSVYFRSELTSWITVTRPANHLDTLDELERALDSGSVVPCAAQGSSQAFAVSEDGAGSSSLMRKLQVAYKRYGGQQSLLSPSTRHCLRCTHRSDRVCFTLLQPPCIVREESPEALPFREHVSTTLSAVPLRHGLPLRPALRDLLLRISEGSLESEAGPDCKYRQPPAPATHAVELLSFFRQYCVLLGSAVIVLLLECLVGRYTKPH